MANHCIEVVCTKCGAGYCARGCGTQWQPDTKQVEKLKQKKRHVKTSNEYCSYCKTGEYMVIY